MRKADIIFPCKLKQNSLHRNRTDLEEATDTKPKVRAGNSDTGNQSSRSVFPESGITTEVQKKPSPVNQSALLTAAAMLHA